MLNPGRNDPCPCGSGRKYKQCCLRASTDQNSVNRDLQAAIALHQAGKLTQAAAIYQRILQESPRHPDALHLLGLIAHASGRNEAALDLIGRAIGISGKQYGYHNNLGLVHKALNHLDEAAASYRRALTLKPDFAEANCNLGVVLDEQGRLDEAAAQYRRALATRPDFIEANCNLGMVLAKQGRFDEAMDQYRRVLAVRPDFAEAHYNLGLAFHRQGKHELAVDSGLKAVQFRPAYPEAWFLLGTLYQKLNDAQRAVASFREVLAIDPDHPGALTNTGLELIRQDRLDEAEAILIRLLANDPAQVEARYLLGYTRLIQGRREEATVDCLEALALNPDYAAAFDTWLFARLYTAGTTPEQIGDAHRQYAARFEAPLKPQWPAHRNGPDPDRRLRIGYVSPDFHLHSVAFFIEPILAHHDRSAFEIYCYSNSNGRDEFTERFIAAANHWIPCLEMSDDALAERIQEDGIDILVDLAGHSAHNRLRVFARKPAPVQVTWLGYPETTGLAAIDYRLTTADVDPAGCEQWHSERLVRLPRTSWCYRPQADMRSPVGAAPSARAGFVTFGSMNNLSKLTPETLTLWVEILRRVSTARLLMTNIPVGSATTRLVDFFSARGIPAKRLSIRGKLPAADFRAALREIDIALDPFPYNGTTTTCQSLWMGIPVVALTGISSVSRSTHALLRLVGLDELCASDEAGYVNTAVELARDPVRLDALRSGLRARVEASPLRDETGVTGEIEAAYRTMWRTWCMNREGAAR